MPDFVRVPNKAMCLAPACSVGPTRDRCRDCGKPYCHLHQLGHEHKPATADKETR